MARRHCFLATAEDRKFAQCPFYSERKISPVHQRVMKFMVMQRIWILWPKGDSLFRSCLPGATELCRHGSVLKKEELDESFRRLCRCRQPRKNYRRRECSPLLRQMPWMTMVKSIEATHDS
jgi:hypothetical protein